MKRIVIFSHYDIDGLIDEYVVYYIRHLSKVADKIIFISTSTLLPNEGEKIQDFATVRVRENIGYDFYSWKVGLEHIDITDIDELIFCNDSVFAPFFSLEDMFNWMENRCDFWGITDSYMHVYHLQSYFLVFRQPLISSPIFTEFFSKIEPLTDKEKIIRNYELKLTQTFINAGFKCGALANMGSLNKLRLYGNSKKHGFFQTIFYSLIANPLFRKKINPSVHLGCLLLLSGVPTLKTALFKIHLNDIGVWYCKRIIEKYTDYNYSLIKNHLSRVNRRTQDEMFINDSISRSFNV